MDITQTITTNGNFLIRDEKHNQAFTSNRYAYIGYASRDRWGKVDAESITSVKLTGRDAENAKMAFMANAINYERDVLLLPLFHGTPEKIWSLCNEPTVLLRAVVARGTTQGQLMKLCLALIKTQLSVVPRHNKFNYVDVIMSADDFLNSFGSWDREAAKTLVEGPTQGDIMDDGNGQWVVKSIMHFARAMDAMLSNKHRRVVFNYAIDCVTASQRSHFENHGNKKLLCDIIRAYTTI
jgi:hypothetical protein